RGGRDSHRPAPHVASKGSAHRGLSQLPARRRLRREACSQGSGRKVDMHSQRNSTPFGLALFAASLLLPLVSCEPRYHRGDRYRETAFRARCGKIIDRIDYDRSKIDEIEPGRHEKAKQWYIDDIRNAERDLDRCREG